MWKKVIDSSVRVALVTLRQLRRSVEFSNPTNMFGSAASSIRVTALELETGEQHPVEGRRGIYWREPEDYP